MRLVRLITIVLAGCTSADTSATAVDRSDCSSCHTAPAVADPPPPACAVTDHTTYAAACSQCHGTTAWCPADGSHTRFDLGGSHAGWDCADCHLAISYDPPMVSVTDPTQQITCTSCHWHTRDRVDPFHLGNGDYEYGESTCLRCHAGGRGD